MMDAPAILDWAFWGKWAESTRPGALLSEMRSAGMLTWHPELAALPDVQQDPEWHPEGDVWVHTVHVCNAAADLSGRPPLPTGLSEELRRFAERSVVVVAEMHTESTEAVIQPLIEGRHLVALGYQPGIHFRGILQTCLDAQIRGEFATESTGLDYHRRFLGAVE
jgi:hypothetical protein